MRLDAVHVPCGRTPLNLILYFFDIRQIASCDVHRFVPLTLDISQCNNTGIVLDYSRRRRLFFALQYLGFCVTRIEKTERLSFSLDHPRHRTTHRHLRPAKLR